MWKRILALTCLEDLRDHVDAALVPGFSLSRNALRQASVLGTVREMPGQGTEDSYALSSMQLGMLLHSVYAPESRAYVQQIVGELQEPIDAELFERAWLAVVEQQR